MTLLILYGFPGVGKLTIAQELAPRLEAKIFHNHLVIDIVEPFVTRQHPEFTPFVYDMQRQILEKAMEAQQTDIIFTFAFTKDEPEGVDLLLQLAAFAQQVDVNIHLVHLRCNQEMLQQRIEQESRKAYGKLTSKEHLATMLARYDAEQPLPGRTSFCLDTSNLTAQQAADQILHHL